MIVAPTSNSRRSLTGTGGTTLNFESLRQIASGLREYRKNLEDVASQLEVESVASTIVANVMFAASDMLNLDPLMDSLITELPSENEITNALSEDVEVTPVSESELDWIETHFATLRARYGGQWIAVIGTRIVDHSPDLAELRKSTNSKRISKPFVKWIPPQDEESIALVL